MFEHKSKPLATPSVYYRRVAKNLLVGGAILAVCLVIGIVGYHYTSDIPWIDALHNASMMQAVILLLC